MMGAGKSTLGKMLAERSGLRFIDVDADIEAACGMSISELFRAHGEDEFRRRELEAFRKLAADSETAVLAAGGGAFCQEETGRFLRDNFVTVFLNVAEDELLRRLEAAGVAERPLLASPDWRRRVRQLVAERYPKYGRATHMLKIADESPETTVTRMSELLELPARGQGEGNA